MGRPKRPRDINQLAASIVAEATREDAPTQEPDTRNPHAVALGKLGASKGGQARAAALTPEERQAIARKANKARWTKQQIKKKAKQKPPRDTAA